MRTDHRKALRGFTLIEMVIFILVVGIAFSAVMVIFINSSASSGDAMIRVRTVELAQSLMEEILLKKFDENTPQGGQCVTFAAYSRCTSGPSASPALGSDGETRAAFDDVDDYHNIAYCGTGAVAINPPCTNPCQPLLNAAGNDISGQYPGFSVCIQVSYAGNEMNAVAPGTGTSVLDNDAKRIDVIITDPLDSRLTFSAYRTNF